MIRRPGAYELIVGVTDDRQFGPMLLFGHGGTAVEVIDDRALALPPLNLHLARELMARTRDLSAAAGLSRPSRRPTSMPSPRRWSRSRSS